MIVKYRIEWCCGNRTTGDSECGGKLAGTESSGSGRQTMAPIEGRHGHLGRCCLVWLCRITGILYRASLGINGLMPCKNICIDSGAQPALFATRHTSAKIRCWGALFAPIVMMELHYSLSWWTDGDKFMHTRIHEILFPWGSFLWSHRLA